MIMENSLVNDEDVVAALLREWGLEKLIAVFKDNDVDFSFFCTIDRKIATELIKSIGLREKFLQRMAEFIGENNNSSTISEGQNPVLLSVLPAEDVSQETRMGDAEDKSKDPDFAPSVSEESSDSDDDIPLSQALRSKGNRKVKQALIQSDVSENTVSAPIASAVLEPSSVPSASVPQLSLAPSACFITEWESEQEFKTLNLEAELKNFRNGTAVIAEYKTKQTLSDKTRGILCGCLATKLIKCFKNPSRAHYECCTDKIKQLFPNEDKSVYYVPPKTEGPSQRMAKGKLYDRIRNDKTTLRLHHALPPSSKKRKAGALASTEPIAADEIVLEAQELEAIEWLKYNQEPWAEVIAKWKELVKYRQNYLKNNEGLVTDFVNKFKVLKLPQGHELIEIDFKSAYSDSKESLFLQWAGFREKIRKHISRDNVKDPVGLEYLQTLFDNNVAEEVMDVAALLILPSLVPPKSKVLRKGKYHKTTLAECRSSFIEHVKVAAEVESKMKERRTFAVENGGRLQPYVMLVGESAVKPTAAYTCIDEFCYKFTSPLKAVDVCYKAFFALNAQYPAESEQVWQLLQKALYNMSTPHDKVFISVNSLMSTLRAME